LHVTTNLESWGKFAVEQSKQHCDWHVITKLENQGKFMYQLFLLSYEHADTNLCVICLTLAASL